MSSRVVEPSPEELRERRKRLLEHVGMTRDELNTAAEEGALSSDQFWVWEDIKTIDFLLDDDDDER